MERKDVVIIGAGIGGLITGALLAKLDRRRVLVLEKESQIGGRVISFGGHHGSYSKNEYLQLLRGAAGMRIFYTDPSLDDIIEKNGLFENFITDCGWHLVTAAGRNRYSLLAKAMGKRIQVAPQVGLLIDRNGNFIEFHDYVKQWPAEAREEHNRMANERVAMSMAETEMWDHVDIHSYLCSTTTNQQVRDNYELLGRFLLTVNDAKEVSTGEFMRTNNIVSQTGLNLSTGGGIGEVVGGFKTIANTFADIIRESGGEIHINARVREVLVEGYRATGVVVEYGRHDHSPETIAADTMVVNVPMDLVREIVPDKWFVAEHRRQMDRIHSATGLAGMICVKELLEPWRSQGVFLLDSLPGAPVMKGGNTWLGWEQTTGLDPSRKLGSSHLIQSWIPLWTRDPDERCDDEKLRALVDAELAWFRGRYPQFDKVYEWSTFAVPDRVYGVAPIPGLIGNRRIPGHNPIVPNLFFTGDTPAQRDLGTNGAAHAAMLCANAVTGRNFLALLPEYMR